MKKRVISLVLALALVTVFVPIGAVGENKGTIVPNQTYSGQITDSNTSDQYTIVLGLPGTLTIALTRDNTAGRMEHHGVELSILNSSGSWLEGTSGGFTFPYTYQTDLQAGTYHIEIIQRPAEVGANTGTYSIRTTYTAHETEDSNNTIATARLMTTSQTASGIITSQVRSAFYRYDLAQAGRLTASVNLGSSSAGGLYAGYLRWYDANGTQLKSDYTRYGASLAQYMDLEAGTYYLEIAPYGSSYSGTYTLTVPIVPTTPLNFTATAGDRQVVLAWSAPSIGSPFTRFEVSRDNGSTWSTASSAAGHTFTGLVNGTSYTFRVRAVNGAGTGTMSDARTAIPTAGVPTAPLNVTATPGDAQVALVWSLPATGSPFTRFEVSSNNGITWVVASGNTTHTFTGLVNGTSYTFRVRAVNGAGEGAESDARTAIPIAGVPTAPLNVTATPGDAQVALVWSLPATGSPFTRFEVSSNNGITWVAASGNTTHTFTGLVNGTSYTFRVRAINDAGEGAESDARTAIPIAGVPTAPLNVTATPGDAQVVLVWNLPATGSPFTRFEVSSNNGITWVAASGNTTHTFTGLVNGTSYTFRVRAINDAGEGAESDVRTAIPSSDPQPLADTVPNIDTADNWAHEGINEAYQKGFIPEELLNNFNYVINRQEFCRMAVRWVEYATGKSIDTVLFEKGLARSPNAFTDTSDPDILAAYALGITAGIGNNQFNPLGQFPRQQAAMMIMNACRAIGADVSNLPTADFADMNSAASWAHPGINFVRVREIMRGIGGGNFGPHTLYTIQESIVTFNNIKVEVLP
ncbi:MAG: fibronectin type III domain-containing protein [Oscillospiraceae bacterium]|nr:fibronectin type III domain-containing protein [Oscillospiraceae bacterium]